ncbi:MAG: 4-hydroxy-3-methylbut-2-enyl diphosphate reductase [Acholeplasmataceae bacterium]|nr:4-hydroxy-3-methylbut-2-enyl diphosphate reductase [Acholeplasmataceae bacterium]
MKIIIAENCGFCYGVKRAVEMALKTVKDKNNVATLGPLIHNPQMIQLLAKKGVECLDKLDDFPVGSTVVLRSHGVSPNIYEQAKVMGLTVIDATCPNVLNAQKRVRQLADEGYLPIIIGEKKHPEVQSILAWAGKMGCVVETIEDVKNVPTAEKYGVVVQTTFESDKFEKILEAIQNNHKGQYKVERTICNATAKRQASAVALAKRADAVFVIGGRNSANTRHLYDIVKEICNKTFHIETADDISLEMIKDCNTIGITAGASTPDWLIKEAIHKMETMETMESLLEKESMQLHIGMTVQATVVAITKDEVIVDFGYQSEGRIAFSQWALDATRESIEGEVKVGDIVTAKVVASENQDGLVELSKIKAEAEKAWETIKGLATDKKVLDVKGLSAVKGGLTVSVNGVVGFIPASHLELTRVDNIASYVGRNLQAEVIEFDPAKKRLVLSRRELLKAEKTASDKLVREEKEARFQAVKNARIAAEKVAYESINEGMTVKGTIKKIADFGLFVEIAPGVQGLVHVSEMSWDRSKKTSELYKEGDEVEVFVKSINQDEKRIALSIKMLTQDPWQADIENIKEGKILDGTVERFLTFGAVVSITANVEGLVHVSEISDQRVNKPEDVLKIGQKVRVKVIKVDKKHKKVSLSIAKARYDEDKAEYTPFLNTNPELSVDISEKFNAVKTE